MGSKRETREWISTWMMGVITGEMIVGNWGEAGTPDERGMLGGSTVMTSILVLVVVAFARCLHKGR